MGCRCCKMIQSYIFDREEVQSPGCIHEVNNYKHEEQGSNKLKFKENSEIQEYKHEEEINRREDKDQINSTKETLWNHGSNDSQQDGHVKCVAKLDAAVNGGSSCAGVHPLLNPNTNTVQEASKQGTTSHSESSSASNRDLHTQSNRSGQELDLETGRQRKAACGEPNSTEDGNSQSAEDGKFLKGHAALETQNNAIQLPDTDYPQNGNQIRNYVEKDSFSDNCAHSDQNTGPSATQDQNLYSPMKESSIEHLKGISSSLSESITAAAVTKAAQAPTHSNHKDLNGETEEEDAEVAAALAALEAATAGEDLEDDDEC